MQWYEIDALLEGYDLKQRDSWEKVRTMVVASLQANCTRKLNSKKVFPLPWDKRGSVKTKVRKEKPAKENINMFKEMALAHLNSEKNIVDITKI